MTELLTAAQMRSIEQAAIDSGEVTGLELMERAGQGVVDAVMEEWPDLAKTSHKAVALCGPGNNGGDGFVIARLLKQRGWEVEVFLYGDAEKLPADAKTNYEKWREMGEVLPMDPERAGEGDPATLIFDAMFGTGLTRPIPLDCAHTLQAVSKRVRKTKESARRSYIIAVDLPSGMDADTGEFMLPPPPQTPEDNDPAANRELIWEHSKNEGYPRTIFCNLCVTFHRAKLAHYLTEVGFRTRPVVVDIGLTDGRQFDMPYMTLGRVTSDEFARVICPSPTAKSRDIGVWVDAAALTNLRHGGHKYERGHALILGGGAGKGGAARLAARAALRVGAGLATLGVPHEAIPENAAQLNAIMLREIGDPTALVKTLEDPRIGSVCMGPGLGVGQAALDLVSAALAESRIPGEEYKRRFILDADALTSFEDDPNALFSMLHETCVLTPHEGEFARLFPDLGFNTRFPHVSAAPSKLDATKRAAERAGCIILLKGPITTIASPDGRASIHAAIYDRRTNWLGTAGAGDVLAGMITGLLANRWAGFNIHPIVEVAAFLHVEAARSFGPGLIAEDLPEELPKVFKTLGL